MEKIARIMELFWLALTFISGALVVWMIVMHGWNASNVFVWLPLVCAAMWAYRRFTRKKMKEWAEREEKRRDQA